MTADRSHAPDSPTGLRERKKRQTREALSWAALRLAVERGLENVRVEDIAAEAGVSARTFNNYFSGKYEAIVSRSVDRAGEAAAALRTRPADEPLWDAITCAMMAPFEGPERTPTPEWTAGVRLMMNELALQGEYLKGGMAAAREFAVAVAERTGTDADRDLYPSLVGGAVQAALNAATEQWLRCDPPVPMAPLLRDALRLVATGLPDPSAGQA
ncbi:TetR family transcriptional regulator [Streptomyces sp. NPDC096339]|uniref:acyl-CoA-like ligand-binding transcription factor n=1 Tax=Streptomyces sp. NPDC096339 TaxID=3366086 RepID=UPI0038246A11